MRFRDCLECKDLDRALKLTLANYMAARAAPFYRICTDIAAKKEVDMERAKTDLEEHQLVCSYAIRAEAAERTGDFCAPVAPAASKPD
jgi:hypothetical protein